MPPPSRTHQPVTDGISMCSSRAAFCACTAIAETEYRRTLDAHAVLDFADLLLRALELLAPDGGVRAKPLSAGIALSPRAGRRVSGHQPRPVGAGLAARPVVGRRRRADVQRSTAAFDLHRRRSQAVDLRLPRRRRVDPAKMRVATSRRFARRRRAARDLAQFPVGAGPAGVCQRRVRTTSTEGRGPPRRVSLRRRRSISARRGR